MAAPVSPSCATASCSASTTHRHHRKCDRAVVRTVPSRLKSKRFYIPEEAGRGQVARCARFGALPGQVVGMLAGEPGPGGAPWLDERPGCRPSCQRTLVRAGNGYGVVPVACPVCRSCPWQARGCVYPFGGARSWWPRGHGAGRRGRRDQSDPAAARRWRGPVKPAITRCPCPALLTRPARWRWPGHGSARRASRSSTSPRPSLLTASRPSFDVEGSVTALRRRAATFRSKHQPCQ